MLNLKNKMDINTLELELRKITRLQYRSIDLEMKKLKFSRTQWIVLNWIDILSPCSQKELLINLDIDAAHLTRVLDEFEKNGYIVRKRIKNDRRALFIQMTDYSKKELMPTIKAIFKKQNTILLGGLDEHDKKNLNGLLQTLKKNLESALIIK